MTRKRPDVQRCGERHEPYLHCLTCNPPPPENPDRLQGPEVGAECIYRSRAFPDGVRVVVTARSYVWAPGDPSYHGGNRRYDWKTIRILEPEKKPRAYGSNGLCVDDKDLEPLPPARNLPDLWGADGPQCADGCSPVDVSIPFEHGPGTCALCPHVRCAICGAWAEPVSPRELTEAWGAMLDARPVDGQSSWLE